MKEESLVKFLNLLGYIPEGKNGDWITLSCPLHHLHEKKSDFRPSCGISISETEESVVNCFACGSRSLGTMLAALVHLQHVPREALRLYFSNEILKEDVVALEYKDKYQSEKIDSIPIPVPDYILEYFSKPNKIAREYLESRGMEPIDNVNSYKDGIVFLIRDLDHKTYWLHFRGIKEKTFRYLKPYEFNIDYEWGRNDSWYNLENIDWEEPVYCVEGEGDVLRLNALGIKNVVASHGSIGKKSKKIKRLNRAKTVILAFDADQTGKMYTERAKYQLTTKIIELDWSKANCKDAGELKSKRDFDKVWKSRTGNRTFVFKDKFTRSSI